jgi:hypothetical protein
MDLEDYNAFWQGWWICARIMVELYSSIFLIIRIRNAITCWSLRLCLHSEKSVHAHISDDCF